jgi:hypothetical protein
MAEDTAPDAPTLENRPALRALAANALTGFRVRAIADDDPLALALRDLVPATCGCPDCLNAAGLLAYLCDLLGYAVQNLRENGNAVELARLATRFHQPFADIPASCETVETPVRQVRIAVEVLRSWLPNATEPDWYLQEAYEALLRGIGTSVAELRSARTAQDDERQELARRIGISVPRRRPPGSSDALDALFDPMTAAGRSEARLEQLFGLRSTRRAPLDPDVLPGALLLAWRRERVRQDWTREDHPANQPLTAPPLIEPDQLGPSDFTDTSSPAFRIFSRRDVQVGVIRANLRDAIVQFGLDAVLGDRFTSGLWQNTSIAAVIQIADRRDAGQPVGTDVAALGLDLPAFDRFAEVVRLEQAGGPITDPEWEDLYSVLVTVVKRGLYSTWRAEEVTPPAWLGAIPAGSFPILLEPAVFRIRPTPAQGGLPWRPIEWRSDPAARRLWERTLRTRIEQEHALPDDLRAVVDRAEEAVLVRLRQWLLDTLIGSPIVPAGTRDRGDWVSRRLQIDMKAGACDITTRAAQAMTTVQGVLFGARHGILEDRTITLDAPSFDDEWAWLGSYATWRAAMLVFLYPETALRPTLRRALTPGFAALVRRFPTWASIDAAGAEEAAAEYSRYFADVCSLSLLGTLQREQADPALSRRIVRLARAAASGRVYASAYTQLRRASAFPGQPPVESGVTGESFWDEVPGIPQSADLVGMTVYSPATGPARIGAYLRWVDAGTLRYRFTSTDGTRWSPTPRDLDGMPGLIRTGGLAGAAAQARPLIVDLAGTGRPQVVLQTEPDAADRRLVQVLVEEDGGLVARDSLLLEPGWQLPQRPAVFTRGQRARLLAVNPSGGRIGLVGRDAAGALRLLSSTADVLRSDGSSGWPVAFGSAADPTVFVVADPDGSGQRLLVFERMATPDWFSPIGTAVTTCDVVNDAFVFSRQQTLSFHIAALQPQGAGFAVRWDGFVPVASGYGMQSFEDPRRQDIVVQTVRTTFWPTTPQRRPPENEETRSWVGLLRWNRSTSTFDLVPGAIAWSPSQNGGQEFTDQQDFPAVPGVASWPVAADDQFLPLELNPAFADQQDILVHNRSRGAIGILTYTGVNQLTVRFHAEGAIGSGQQAWQLAAGQLVLPFDPDGDRRQDLLVVDPAQRRIGVLGIGGGAGGTVLTVDVRTVMGARIDAPDGDPTQQWQITTDSFYACGDVDRDGHEEIVVRGAFGRIGVLRTVPPPVVTTGRPVSPSGVSLLQVDRKRTSADLDGRRAQIRQAYDRTIADSGVSSLEVALLDEAYYFVPVELALRLQTAGVFPAALDWFAAVYDYARGSNRKIADKLVREEGPLAPSLERAADWLTDPLNPHTIAATRPNAYSRFTILAIVRCLLGWADAEFTRDTTESVARARELYLAALDLLRAPELAQRLTDCSDLVGRITLGGEPELDSLLADVRDQLGELTRRDELEAAVVRIEEAWADHEPPAEHVATARRIAGEAIAAQHPHRLADLLEIERRVAAEATSAFVRPLADRPGNMPSDLPADQPPGGLRDVPFDPQADTVRPSVTFCVPPDRTAQSLRLHAELALRRIRDCRTIAGLESRRAAVTDLALVQSGAMDFAAGPLPFQPLPYRYGTLIERARQLVQLAAQIEASMLDALRQRDVTAYDELRARRDLALQQAGVRLKDLDVTRAGDTVQLAGLQRDRAVAQRKYLDVLYEREKSAGETRVVVAWGKVVIEIIKMIASSGASSAASAGSAGAAEGGGSGLGSLGGIAGAFGEFISAGLDAYARPRTIREQQQFADRDVEIAQQQIQVMQDGVALAEQDRLIAQMRADQAQEIVDFLAHRFTGSPLYEWMSGVLQEVYRFFLQQATSMGRLAEAQLAFERQELVPAFIQDDYWTGWNAGVPATSDPGVDRRGLTGSARLLADLVALDDHAFRTAQRKLRLSRTISLAAYDALAFEQFRATGVLRFATPSSLFDRDFPGHYLRLVTGVRASVVALVPPATGIRATLATTGTSYVTVVSGDGFARVPVQRGPETMVLTAPSAPSGLLELEPRSELLVPFENIGVDTTWRFSMPRPANPIDFSGIADVVVTIDYTALASDDLRQRVLQGLDPAVRSERAFSMRYELQDQWYDLHNPDQTAAPLMVQFRTEASDFRPDLTGLVLRHVTVAFTPRYAGGSGVPPGAWDTAMVTDLSFTADGGAAGLGGSASPTGGVITTRPGQGNAAGWQALTAGSPAPVGTWSLRLTSAARAVLDSGELDDILLILGYEGTTSPWPEEG